MWNRVLYAVIICLLWCLPATVRAEVLPGAKIEYGACDPRLAAPDNRSDLPIYEQSCEAQNITRDGDGGTRFWIRVSFQPSRPSTQEGGGAWGNMPGTSVPNNLFHQTFPSGATYDTATRNELQTVSEPVAMNIEVEGRAEAIIDQARILFYATYEYNKACVYAYLQGDTRIFRVSRNYPLSLDQVNDDITYQGGDGVNIEGGATMSNQTADTLADNCVYAPAPPKLSNTLSWSSMISDVCLDYDTSASRFVHNTSAGPISRSFTGVVVECIEETFMNLFNPAGAEVRGSFFSKMQDGFKGLIKAALTLYVIIYGLNVVLSQSIPAPRELTWFWLRIGLVFWFAAGSGMAQLYPMLVNSSKDLSAMVFESGRGRIDDVGYHELREAVNQANNELLSAQADVTSLTNQIIQMQNQLSSAAQGVDQKAQAYFAIYELLYGNGSVPAGSTPPLPTPPSTVTGGAELALRNKDAQLNRPLTGPQTGMTYMELAAEDPQPGASPLFTVATQEKDAAIAAYNNAVDAYNAAMNTLISTLSSSGDMTDTTGGSGTYTPPLGCVRVDAEVVGGGAAGRRDVDCTSACDYSGGAGGYARGRFYITASTTSIPYYVGPGGRSNGANGSRSWFKDWSELYASGGGQDRVNSREGGGAGGSYAEFTRGGGDGVPTTCSSHPGGVPYIGGTPHPGGGSCSGGAISTQGDPGTGGCSADDTCSHNSYSYGSDGMVRVRCIEMGVLTADQVNTLADGGNSEAIAVRDAATVRDEAHFDMVLKGGEAVVAQDIGGHIVNPSEVYPNNQYALAQTHYYDVIAQYNDALRTRDDLVGQLAGALSDYNAVYNSYLELSAILSGLGSLESQLEAAEAELEREEDELEAAVEEYSAYVIDMDFEINEAAGYQYCDFSLESYDPGKEYMRLWDSVDCKLVTYLGVGLGSDPNAPESVILALTSVISSAFGMLILFFTVIFFVFIIMLVLRIVHIYIMAFIGVSLLIYISPLIIPSVLFEHTKAVYQKWLKEIMARLLQPVVLFAFLALVFGAMDHVFFGDNKVFTLDNRIVNKYGGSTPPGPGQWDLCEDSEAVGCLYQTASYGRTPVFSESFEIFSLPNVNLGGGRGFDLFIGLAKMVLICFVVYAILQVVEDLSTRLVGGFSGGAAAMAGISAPAPRQIGNAMVNSIGAAKDGAKSMARRAMKRREGAAGGKGGRQGGKGRGEEKGGGKGGGKGEGENEGKSNAIDDNKGGGAGGGDNPVSGAVGGDGDGGMSLDSATDAVGDAAESGADGASGG